MSDQWIYRGFISKSTHIRLMISSFRIKLLQIFNAD